MTKKDYKDHLYKVHLEIMGCIGFDSGEECISYIEGLSYNELRAESKLFR